MGDALKNVQPGQPLEIPAEAYNTFIDAARRVRFRQHDRRQDPLRLVRQADIVRVRNQTGGALPRFSVVGLGEPVIAPTANLPQFQNAVCLDATTPDVAEHLGRFAILFEPLAAGAIGRAVAAGVSVAKVNVADTGHPFCDVTTGTTSSLVSSRCGTARILWKEAGTGVKWAVIRLGHGPTQAGSLRFTLLQDRQAGATQATLVQWWGSQEDVQPPPAPIEVHFLGSMFPRALTGAEGIAAYDAANDRYVVTYCDQAALMLQATLGYRLCGEEPTAQISAYSVMSVPGFGQLPPGIALAGNPWSLAGKSGASCLLLWNAAAGRYDVAQMQHVQWARAPRDLNVRLEGGVLRLDWWENDLWVMTCQNEYSMHKAFDLCDLDCSLSSSSQSASSLSHSSTSDSQSRSRGSQTPPPGSSQGTSQSGNSSQSTSGSASASDSHSASGPSQSGDTSGHGSSSDGSQPSQGGSGGSSTASGSSGSGSGSGSGSDSNGSSDTSDASQAPSGGSDTPGPSGSDSGGGQSSQSPGGSLADSAGSDAQSDGSDSSGSGSASDSTSTSGASGSGSLSTSEAIL